MSTSNRSNKIIALAFVVALVAVASLSVVAYSATSRYSQDASAQTSTPSSVNSTLTVSGVGIVNVVPDEIVADFGVTNQGTNASQVLASNSITMNAVISAIENAGVNSSDIRTTQLSLSPIYKYDNLNGSSTITGYQASNSVEVTLTGSDTAKVGVVVNAAVNAGANQVQSIGYTISDSLQA
ncbi:MAG: SIMPL domain-containing protein [Nitrososphaerota archaeon]|nr:SIMPL domain-containing protein [Nitrososphaerota archaeon]